MINYSFVIPHKNTPQLLHRCLDSIPQRDDVEIIIVDNNSSRDIVDFEKYPGSDRSDVTIIKDNNSIGAGGARNTGLKHARGIWVLFADADDYYSGEVLDVLDKYKDGIWDVVYFNFIREVNGVSTPLPRTLKFLIDAFRHPDRDIDILKYRYSVPWNKMVKRSLIDAHHVTFEDCIVGNDVFYTYQVGYFARSVAVEDAKLYHYSVTENSVSTRKNNSTAYYECFCRHHFQCKEFLKFVHHKYWTKSMLRNFASIYLKRGLGQLVLALRVYVCNYRKNIIQKHYFVSEIKKNG